MDEPTFDFQKVGEMFVMQYYTQMHKDPTQMYKFYQESSSFVHGGPEMGRGETIRGRKAIHEKIVSLNLHQVHTKIRQVDSHPSVPNEVGPCAIVQVTGELSIARETMRPFVQTFVLAQESERKFFVYNDIFRYQVYDEDLDNDQDQQEEDPTEHIDSVVERPVSNEAQSPSVPDEITYHTTEQMLPSDEMSASTRSPVPTGSTGHSDVIHDSGSTWTNEQQYTEPQSNGLPEEAHMTLGEEPTYPLDPVEDENTTPIDTNNDEKEELLTTTTSDNKTVPSPGTWAARIAQNITKPSQPPAQQTYFGQTTTKPAQPPRLTNATNPLPQREQKPVKKLDRLLDKKPFVSSSNPPNVSRSAPDTCQVFVGGLPSNTTQNDLKEVFAQYGTIVEIRVNPKNFGFVVFDNEKSVRDIMSLKDESPLYLGNKKLNIEEKRQSAPKGGIIGPSVGRKAPLRPANRSQKRS